MIDPVMAEHAEKFECYCGRLLIVHEVDVCEGCELVPEKCNCKELPNDEQ